MKKGYIYILIILIILLIIVLGAWGYNINTKIKNNKVVEKELKKNMEKDNLQEVDKDLTSKEERPIYNILGRSNKLTPNQWKAMEDWRNKVVNLSKENKDVVYINGYSTEKMVALTFDDGPDNNITSKIVKTLTQYNVKGNFFFIGEQVRKYPFVVEKAYNEGNLVASHSNNHVQLDKLSADEIKNEISKGEEEIFKVIGKRPKLIRPPYGTIDTKVIEAVKNSGDKIVLWSIDTLDWSQRERKNITKNIIDNLRPGEIILMHSNEDKSETLKALPDIISGIKEKGYQIVTLDKLLKVEGYK
ncbi:polysaccharide deacetylase family protein [Clostridium lundense]|uniref:polysaccharide deacetylase family protein n=1 Tax=Clostridium lundense TaxID=319475 RepID=UPI00146FC257|nr:polysaccharide deacetylase family protein [Clostridium lundense]